MFVLQRSWFLPIKTLFFVYTHGLGGSLPSGQGRLATGISQPVSFPGGPNKQQSMHTHKPAQQKSRATMRHAAGVQSPPSQNARPTTNCYVSSRWSCLLVFCARMMFLWLHDVLDHSFLKLGFLTIVERGVS